MIEHITPESKLLDENLKKELSGIFLKLTEEVVLKAVIDMTTEKGVELAGFLTVIESLSPKISLEMYMPDEAEQAVELDTAYLPVTGLYKDGRYAGIAFHGVPGGKEINSFVLAIYNLAGPGQEVSSRAVKMLRKLERKMNIKICVSLACHHCPKVVAACQQIAVLSGQVEAEMIDAALYPKLVEKYKIERVPMIIVNDEEVYIGPKTIEEMTEILVKISKNKL
ncbi:thioredoxin family protein [Mediterraneibacter agrestimuris]|uniref:thioredoxin family protein n=1 Tax=Mediterraneibacter agrestimuris TaxID=2941333 RepID=UPI00204176B5|nr:thioredoxin family protein [Mediterraneibacter agrestimuris]